MVPSSRLCSSSWCAQAVAAFAEGGYTIKYGSISETVLERAPFNIGGPRKPDKRGYRLYISGTKPVPKAEVSAASEPGDSAHPVAAPSVDTETLES